MTWTALAIQAIRGWIAFKGRQSNDRFVARQRRAR